MNSPNEPFFTNAQGDQQKSIYHSYLTRHRDLMVKFKQHPFPSQFPRDGTPGKIVYMELPDGLDYTYQIENEHIVELLAAIEPNIWYRITASGQKAEASLVIHAVDLDDQQERKVADASTPVSETTHNDTTEQVEDSGSERVVSTHTDCASMTLETVTLFENAGTVLESEAIARIYNTHFIALSKQRGGLIR